MSEIKLLLGDCLDVMKSIHNKSINLIIVDPPYNIGKAEWDKIDDYIGWCGKWITECQRVLKDSGGFYFFHNDMPQVAKLMNWIEDNTQFIFKQFIVWNKRFDGVANKGFLDGFIVPDGLRNYQQMAEYVLFYTFQEVGFNRLMNYFMEERKKLGWNYLQCDEFLGIKASYCYWDKPTTHPYRIPEEIHYKKLQSTGFFFREYENLRQEYESLRYTFNNQKMYHSVWNYEIAPQNGHITPKPVPLIENIIRHSSNEDDVILDCFMGSGTTGVACAQTNRNFVGIEIDTTYFKIAEKRIADAQQQMRLL